ncbi:MAG: right-handed parallel beta-helix repeat-containing protein [Mycobacteriales bacterium]
MSRLVSAAVLLTALGFVTGAQRALADVPVDEVHYTFGGPTSITLDWRGTAQDVRYGLTTSYDQTAQGVAPGWTPVSSAGPFWQAQIGGLAAGATYHYSIGGGPDYTFHTPPTGDFRFDAIGDIGDTSHFSHLADTFSAISADQPNFVLMDGDLSYANAANATQAVVDQHFNDVMAFSTRAAYMPAWGNHEWESEAVDDLRNYKGRLLMPNAQASPGSPAVSCCGDDWGWFDAGGVRFIAYPEPYTSASWQDWRTQANTLMNAAQLDPSVHYIVTYGHRPAYSTGYHPGDSTLAGILDGLGATYSKYVLNVNGHSHDYERFQPINGVTHITVGTPSSEETPWSGTDARTAFRAYHLAHLRVDVDSAGMLIQAVCDDAASRDDTTCAPGSVLDEATIGTPPAEPPVTAIYVDKSSPACSDTGPGDVAQPYCTIAKGTARVQPGQTVYVGNGSYAEQVKPPSGTATAPVTVTASPGATPVVGAGQVYGVYLANKSNVVVSGLTVTGTLSDGVYVTGGQNVTLSGLHVSGSGQPTADGYAKGIKLIGTTGSTVSGNTVDHNTDSGIYLAQGSTGDVVSGNNTFANARGYTRAAPGIDLRSGGNTVVGNTSHDNEDTGIQLYTGSDNSLVANNVVYRNGDHGIDDYQAPGQRIIGNTAYQNLTAGINVEGGSTGATIANNVSVDNGLSSPRSIGDIRVDAASQSGASVDYNLVYLHAPGAYYVWGTTNYATVAAFTTGSGGQEAHGLGADPRWASPDTGDFRLTAGSPAIDSANSGVSGERATDLAGVARYDDPSVANNTTTPRGYDDRGALEAGAGTPGPSPNAALTASPVSGTSPLTVTADASASTAGSSPIGSYTFNFGDGSALAGPQAGATATHQYTTPGTYTLAVSVTDTAGLVTTTSKLVSVGAAGNLVGNSTFETNLTGWAALDGCTLTRVAGGHNEGWAANLLNTSTTPQSCTLNDSPNWIVHTVAGHYTASAWVRSDTVSGQIKLRLREYVGSTAVGTPVTVTVTATGDWQQITLPSYTVASPGSTLDLNVYQTGQPVGTNLQIDDVTASAS